MRAGASEKIGTSPAKIAKPVLVWERAGTVPEEFELAEDHRLTIGRDRSNDILIDSPLVSKMHAVIRVEGGLFHLEDLQSSNGTLLNGKPIAVSALNPGDVIEIGEERIVFQDKAASAARGPASLGKTGRLLVAALGSAGIMVALLVLLIRGAAPPAAAPAGETVAIGQTQPSKVESTLADQIVGQARAGGVREVDALLDAGLSFARSGRLREAGQLYAGALALEPENVLAKARLQEVDRVRQQRIAQEFSAAERSFNDLRFEDAALAWDRVLQLADESDEVYQAAKGGLDRAREQLAR
jgi:hypothetical protein